MSQKVLYAASTYSHLKNFHLPYIKAFHDAGWTVHAACGGEVRELPFVDRTVTLPFTKRMASPANLSAARTLSALIRAEGYDLISVHTSLAAFFTRLAVPRFGARPRVIDTVHGYLFDEDTPFLKRALLLGAERMTAGVTDLVLTMNRWDYALASRRRLGKRVVNTPGMGVDFSRFPARTAEGSSAARRALGLSDGDFLLVYAAEFSPRKNQMFLIEALPDLPPAVKYLLLGAGAEREACMAQAEALGVADRVYFPGHVDTAPYLAAADLCISSSRSEGLPFNLMEAMSVGLPIVATAVKGHLDLCTGRAAEFLFAPGDKGGFTDRVQRLYADPELCRVLSEHNRRAAEQYSLEAVYPRLLELYGLGGTGGGSALRQD